MTHEETPPNSRGAVFWPRCCRTPPTPWCGSRTGKSACSGRWWTNRACPAITWRLPAVPCSPTRCSRGHGSGFCRRVTPNSARKRFTAPATTASEWIRTATSSSAASAWWQGWAARPIGTAALPIISANRSWRTTPRVSARCCWPIPSSWPNKQTGGSGTHRKQPVPGPRRKPWPGTGCLVGCGAAQRSGSQSRIEGMSAQRSGSASYCCRTQAMAASNPA